MRRLALFCGGFAAGIFLAQYLLPGGWLLSSGLVCLALGFGALLLPECWRKRAILCLVGAALALYWRAQPHSALRSQVRGAIIPGLLGVGEPLIYGVTLPRMKPFVTACLGGAAGGLFIGLIAWWGLPMGLNSAFGPSGLVALPLMTSAQGILPAMAVYAGGILVAWVSGFIFTTLFGCRNVNLD